MNHHLSNHSANDYLFSPDKEIRIANKKGIYSHTTMNFCATSRKHGMYILPMYELDGYDHTLLSSIDETVITNNYEYNLATHQFPGKCAPEGDKYINDCKMLYIPSVNYCMGPIELKKEWLISEDYDNLMIKYYLKESNGPIQIRFRPFVAFRPINLLRKATESYKLRSLKCENGMGVSLCPRYPYLFMQTSKPNQYVEDNKWYYNFEYQNDMGAAPDYHEDLFTNGYFQVSLNEGESCVLSAGISRFTHPELLKSIFINEYKRIVSDHLPIQEKISDDKIFEKEFILEKSKFILS